MKKYLIAMLALSLAVVACEKDKEEDIIANRPSTGLEVKYSVENTEVKSLQLNSKTHDIVLHVDVNNQNLKWHLESNRTWCEVRNEGVGSADIQLHITENEDFESRSQATLTFVAGDFRGYKITVDQNGSVFLIAQPYFIFGRQGPSVVNVNVITPLGADFKIECPDWIKGRVAVASGSGDKVHNIVEITCSANTSESRTGIVKFKSSDGSEGSIFVTQFGSEFASDSDGNIFFPAGEKCEFSFVAPSNTIESVTVPEYASYEIVPSSDTTVLVKVSAQDNLSDCQDNRALPVSLKLNNASASVVDLPTMKQGYTPANGLMTWKGLTRFAEVVNAGGDLGNWQKDGVVTVLQDIDMNAMTGSWTSIGTAEHPFSGSFNGGGFKIKNLKAAPASIFGYCKNATIQNLGIDSSCSFYINNTAISGTTYFGALAQQLESSKIQKCSVAGTIAFAGKNTAAAQVSVGAVAGYVDASSSVKSCDTEGSMTISSNLGTAASTLNIGGVVGSSNGEVSACTSAVTMEISATANELHAGGILDDVNATGKASNNAFLGSITTNSTVAGELCVGGLYGQAAGWSMLSDADKSSSMGSITVKGLSQSTAKAAVGGYIGRIYEKPMSMSGYETTTAITLDLTTATSALNVCVGGFVGGSFAGSECDFTGQGLVNKANITNPTASVTFYVKTCNVGGVIGQVHGNLALTSCENSGNIGLENVTSKSNGYIFATGGIAGQAYDGTCALTSCNNSGVILNFTYNNQPWTTWNSNLSGGIIAGYNYLSSIEVAKTATISNCSSTGGQWGYRGVCGGIAGYLSSANIEKCTSTGNMNGSQGPNGKNTNNHAYVGGIVGVIGSGKIENCNAVMSIYAGSPGSESAQTGGMAGVVTGKLAVTGCGYYGEINKSNTKADEAIGGILGLTTANTTVDACKFGGTIGGQKVTELNLNDLCCGDANATKTNITLWEGN